MATTTSEPGARKNGSHAKGNGEFETEDLRSIAERSREVRDQAAALSESLRTGAKDLEGMVKQQVTQRPYVTLGIAAGVGFVLGGGLSPTIFRRVLGLGSRLALDVVLASVLGTAAAAEAGSDDEEDDSSKSEGKASK